MRVTEESLWAGIGAARLGGRVTDISHAVEAHVRSQPHPTGGSYGILEEYVGHGIGSAMHQPPNVPNYGRAGRGPKLVRGLALAVEPMVTLGSKDRRCSPTTGRSVLSTQAGPLTTSTPSRSPPRERGCSPPSTAASSDCRR